jgi:hypothetical protein
MLLNFYQFSSLDYKYNHKFIPIELLTDYTSLIELGWFLKLIILFPMEHLVKNPKTNLILFPLEHLVKNPNKMYLYNYIIFGI